ncbi:MAG: 30S ribosomal protein S16 [Thermodesulfobacteriota bacterium]
MAVKIRLARYGKKKKPFYRIVVAEGIRPRDGRFIEILGTYDPLENPAKIEVDGEKARAWLKKGALATDTVKTIFKKAGVTEETKAA